MKFIRNWRHLASILHVDLDVIRRLGQYGDISPTIRLFDYLATSKPDLTIKELQGHPTKDRKKRPNQFTGHKRYITK